MSERTRATWSTSTSRSWGASPRAAGGVRTGAGQAGRRQWVGSAYIHSAVDDRSRLAYSEVLDDERAQTVVAFWARALDWFAARGVRVQRVLTDIQTRCISLRSWPKRPPGEGCRESAPAHHR